MFEFFASFKLTGWRPGTSGAERASTSHSLIRGGRTSWMDGPGQQTSYLQSPSVSREGISMISPSARRTASRARARRRITSKLGDNEAFQQHGKEKLPSLVLQYLMFKYPHLY